MLCRLVLFVALFAAEFASGVSITGADWLVHFNLPDQSNTVNSASPGEYCIRDAIIARINALQTGNVAMITAYNFQGTNSVTGGAGTVLDALNAALNRGATISMALDNQINLTSKNANLLSLAGLASRATNPLALKQATNSFGIMHDKFGLFDYGPGNRWLYTASWNFSEAASYQEWNIDLEIRNDQLYAAYSNEFAQLFAGHFHYDTTKSHAHDGALFQCAGAWTNGWVRFCPCTNGATGANNALTDITNRIAHAQQEIAFALNDCTRTQVAAQLVFACNRGVVVNGVMPKSDRNGSSSVVFGILTDPANYAGTNRVNFWTAFSHADGSAMDSNQLDLVHSKWMAIDPFGAQPWLIHGSANWSASALTYLTNNDENIVFVPHGDLARVFYSHFKRITGAFQARNDFWFETASASPLLWMTDTNAYAIETAPAVSGTWNYAASASNTIGWLSITNSGAPLEFLRARRK